MHGPASVRWFRKGVVKVASLRVLLSAADQPDAAALVCNPFFASNALYPVDVMPSWVRAISTVNPLTYQVNALRGLLLGTPANLAVDFAVLVVAAAAGVVAASSLLGRLAR